MISELLPLPARQGVICSEQPVPEPTVWISQGTPALTRCWLLADSVFPRSLCCKGGGSRHQSRAARWARTSTGYRRCLPSRVSNNLFIYSWLLEICLSLGKLLWGHGEISVTVNKETFLFSGTRSWSLGRLEGAVCVCAPPCPFNHQMR